MIIGLLEGAGLLLLIPLLGAAGLDVNQGGVGRLSHAVTATFSQLRVTPTLVRVLVVFLVVNVTLSLVRRAQTLLSASLERDVVRHTTMDLYGAIVRMDWLVFSRMRASDLTVALTTESERAGFAASQLLTMAATATVALVYVTVAAKLSLAMTAAVFVGASAMVILLRRRTERAAAFGAANLDAVRDLHGALTDDLGGMKTIRSFGGEERSFARVWRLANRLFTVRQDSIRNHANAAFWLDIGSVAMLTLLVFIIVDVLHLSPAAVLLLLLLFARVVPRLASLQQSAHFYVNLLPSVHRIAELEARCLAAAEPSHVPTSTVRLRKSIRFDRVSFSYAAPARAISDFSLLIEAGSTVALTGPSGGGKTTAADLMMGLVRPAAGQILIDDVALTRDRIADWRQTVAYVPQETFLFHDTIRANLLWAVPDASDEQLREALVLAAADFVCALPLGLDTIAGDRGVRFSGGERQRIALARALLRRPSLLILDEATSALDSENEARIFDAIHRLHGSTTIVIITHRLSSVVAADLIHVIEDGRVAQSGSWASLSADPNGRFSELWRAQDVPA
jgi:ATP-binding cassette, subfamily C, bacterial